MIASIPTLPLVLLATIGMVAMLIVLFKALRGRAALGLLAVALIGMAGLLLLAPMNSKRHVAVWPRIMKSHTDGARLHVHPGEPPHPPGAVDLTALDALDTMEKQLSELAERGVETAQRIAHNAYEMAATQTELTLNDRIGLARATEEGLGSRASVEVRVPAVEGVPAIVRTTSTRRDANRAGRTSILHNILTAVEIAAFLCVAYVFMDGATRGQFTWSLRLVSVVAFAAIYVALTSLRHQL